VSEPIPCVGRDHELEYLQSALGRAINGNGDALLLSGPMGVGKTRLLEELQKVCKSLNCYHFRCSGSTLDKPLMLPWIELADDIRALEGITSVTMHHLDRFKKETFEWKLKKIVNPIDLELAISSLTGHRVVILLLDDIHKFDEASLNLTRDMVRTFHGQSVLIVTTYDISDQNEMFKQTIASLRAEGLVTDLPIHMLEAEDLRHLVEKRLDRPVDRDLGEFVYLASKGSPMHALETIALMEERKVLIERNGMFRRDRTAMVDVPLELIDLAERRSERLTRDCQRILEFRAMMGPHADLDTLSEMSHIRLDKAIDLIKEMSDDGGFLEKEGRIAFRHPSYEISVLNGISSLRRREMHRAIGELLEIKGIGNVAPESLVMHFFLGEDFQKSHNYSREALLKYYAFSAFQGAKDHLDRMMKNIETIPDDERRWMMESLGDCNYKLGSYAQAHSWYGRCLDPGSNPETISRIFLKVVRCLKEMPSGAVDRNERMGKVDEILSLASSDDRVKGGAWMEKALLLRDGGRLEDAMQAIQKANHLFEAAIDWNLWVIGLLEEIDLAIRTNDLEHAYFLMMHVEELIDSDRDKMLKLRLDVTFGDLFMIEGHYECAIRRYSECMDKARRIGEHGIGSWCAFCQALMLLDMNEFTAALEAAKECEDMSKMTNDEAFLILPKAMRVLLDIVLERVDEAERDMVSLKNRLKALPHGSTDISNGFVDLVDGILKFRLGQDMDGKIAFDQGILRLEGERMGSLFQGLGREWHGSMLLEKGCKNKAKEQFQLSYGIFLRLGNRTHSERLVSQMCGLERGWTMEQMAT
jgi:tetratricopeptide (TPR) repeat protein